MTQLSPLSHPTSALPGHSELPTISVIVPVRNEERFLAETLEMLLRQDYPSGRREILVVDGESEDQTRSIAESYAARHPEIRYFSNPRRWSSAARNIGVRAARGEVILIVDGHCQIRGQDHFRQLAAAFQDPNVACVGRPQPQDISHASLLQQAIAAARSSRLGHHPDSFIYSSESQIVPAHSVAIAYRRTVFDNVGYFDEQFDACEDVELNHRVDQARLKCLFEPRVAVYYHPRATLTGLFRQLARYGRGRIRLWRKHADTMSWKSLLPAAWLVYMALLPVCGWIPLPGRTWYLAGILFYLMAIAWSSLAIAIEKRRFGLLGLVPLVFIVIHAGSGYGLLRELVAPHRSAARATESEQTSSV